MKSMNVKFKKKKQENNKKKSLYFKFNLDGTYQF